MSYATEYALAQDQDFVKRVTAAVVAAAIAIAAESPETANHARRANKAGDVVANPGHWGLVMALGVAAGGTVTAESTDQEIYDRISAIWGAYAS